MSANRVGLGLAIVLLLGTIATGQESAWSKLNPFKKNDRARASVSDEGKSGWSFPTPKMPNLIPKREAGEPSMIQKLGTGTKTLATKTKHTLLPWTKKDTPPPQPYTPRMTGKPGKAEEKKTFFWSSWLKPKPEPPQKEIRTVNDFLAQPRPGF